MTLTGIFRKLFGRRTNTIMLNSNELSKRKSSEVHKQIKEDKSIFEIAHAVVMNEHETLISGRVKRGVFRTGDKVGICNPSETIPKFNAVIIVIKTSLVDVNRITGGSEADFLISVCDNEGNNIMPGDRVYKS